MTDILRPPDQWLPVDTAEREYLPFDFGPQLAPGESVLSATSEIVVVDGVDASAASRLIGGPELSGTGGRQWVQGVQDGVTYAVRIIGITSDSGRTVVIPGRFKGLRVV